MSTTDPTRAFARLITIPALTIDMADAVLGIETLDGETATMALLVNAQPVAVGEGFRVAHAGRWTWFDMPAAEVVGTFSGFLDHAIESSDDEAREAWSTLTDDAADWTDALALYGDDEYGTCEQCWDPIDYCLGHGAEAPEVEEPARMQCTVDGLTFTWSGGEYIETGYIAVERGAYEIDYGHAIGDFVSQDCVNVWDYEAGAPRIAWTLDAFEARCIEYAQEIA
jgi:hypothetical protein